MGPTIKPAIVGAVAFMVLDGVWLGLLLTLADVAWGVVAGAGAAMVVRIVAR